MFNWIVTGFLLLGFWFTPWKSRLYDDLTLNQPETPSSCDLIVNAGPDTITCQGGQVGLSGSIDGNLLVMEWTPHFGLTNYLITNPIATINFPVTYTLTGYALDPDKPNLITNGDFEIGNTDFSTLYFFQPDLPEFQLELSAEATYAIVNNPNLVHFDFSSCADHTGGGGYMMVVNGAEDDRNIWCQTIPVAPNLWYNASAWVTSVTASSPAILKFTFNGIPAGGSISAPNVPCQWAQFNGTWGSKSNTSVTVCITNLNTQGGGNDFAIDDISFVELCAVEDEVHINVQYEIAPEPIIDGPSFLCEGETGVYTADFTPGPPILSYHWTVPPGGTLISGQGTTQATVRWNSSQDASLCLTVGTRCASNDGCYDIFVGSEPDAPLISAPLLICHGESATLNTIEHGPDDVYNWIIPPQVSLLDGAGTSQIDIQWAAAGEAEICLEVTNACGTTENCAFIQLLPPLMSQFDTILCQGTSILINGHSYGNGVLTGTEIFTSHDGCDSLVQIQITEATTLEFNVTRNLCPGDSLFVGGSYQSQAGTYIDSFTSISNCDSLVFTELIFAPRDTTRITLATCNPAEAGNFITTYDVGSCDSIVSTQVILKFPDTLRITRYSCSVDDTVQTVQVLTNHAGCDSTIITDTYPLPSDITLIETFSCSVADTFTSIQLLSNIAGCDSLVIKRITYSPPDTTMLLATTCMFADTGITSTVFHNINGCDSLVLVDTRYVGSYPTHLFQYTCSPGDTAGVELHFTNQFGCDSLVSIFKEYSPPDTTYLTNTTCNPRDTGVVIKVLSNLKGCDSLVISTTKLESAINCPFVATYSVQQPRCYGDTTWVSINIPAGIGPFNLLWEHIGENGIFDFPEPGVYTFPLVLQGKIYIALTAANGLTLLDSVFVDPIPQLIIETEKIGDYNGFGVPCSGDSLGAAVVNLVSSGTPPLSYLWSNGNDTPDLTNLSKGIYTVTVTDSRGCTTTSTVDITEPSPILYDVSIQNIQCNDLKSGGITLSGIQGGILPWETSIDGNSFQPALSYSNLLSGNHKLVIMDQNGCTIEETFTLSASKNWSLSLGPDTIVTLGTNFNLNVVIDGEPEGQLQLTWSDLQCNNCLSRSFKIDSTIIYSVMATDENGCTSIDTIQIEPVVSRDIYIPNIFSPNGDQVNDRFTISSKADIKEIEELTIFGYGGNVVFQNTHFLPNDDSVSWDGTFGGKDINSGVFVYRLVVTYIDQLREVKTGDVTLIR